MRLLHTMLRVGDLQRSIDFYTNVLGMKLLRTSENPEYKYSLAFVGYGPESEEAVIELTSTGAWTATSWVRLTATSRWKWITRLKPANVSVAMAVTSPVKPVRLKAAPP